MANSLSGEPQFSVKEGAAEFLKWYVERWLPLNTAANKASWTSMTDGSQEHEDDEKRKTKAVNEFTGMANIIESSKRFLELSDDLDELTILQIRKIVLLAAEAPGTVPEIAQARAEAEIEQSSGLNSFEYWLDLPGQEQVKVTANDIDRVLVTSRDLTERRSYWETSKTIGVVLRDGLIRLRKLRNQVAQSMGFDSFFSLQVANYGMTASELTRLTDNFIADLKPLYEQLHTWAKYNLAKRYNARVPESTIPAHWLPNRWGQDWPGLVEGLDFDAPFKGKPREFIIEAADRFWVSIEFPNLPTSFYANSDLYPVNPGGRRVKNSHASAWHIDLEEDVRCLMSIEPNSRWFTTAHHELGHVYYMLGYSRPSVPYLLRGGANRAFHEGIGDLIGLAVNQKSYLESLGLFPQNSLQPGSVETLLEMALNKSSVVYMPFAAGVMTQFENDFYSGRIKDEELNSAWWKMVDKYQGIAPPEHRPETFCDAASKSHINDDPGQYYDYAIGTILKFQLHDHIAKRILKQDPRNCNYYGNEKVGAFLRDIFSLGATRDWNKVLLEVTGETLTSRPMMEYFEPLMDWLKKENRGRQIGWN